jgi:hypothetical protein
MSNESQDQRQALIAEITRAFDGVTLGDGITLHQAVAIDDYKSPEEQWSARRLDRERRWQDVSRTVLAECQTAPSFLDQKGFVYYLPAFMVRGLEDLDHDTGVSFDSCVYRLLHDFPNSLRKLEPASIAAKYGFTGAQSRAVARFLRFVVGPDDEFTTEHATTLQAVAKWEEFANEVVPTT